MRLDSLLADCAQDSAPWPQADNLGLASTSTLYESLGMIAPSSKPTSPRCTAPPRTAKCPSEDRRRRDLPLRSSSLGKSTTTPVNYPEMIWHAERSEHAEIQGNFLCFETALAVMKKKAIDGERNQYSFTSY